MKLLPILFALFLLAGCSAEVPTQPVETTSAVEVFAPTVETTAPETEPIDPIQDIIDNMSLEERVGQLFLARCDAETAVAHVSEYHLGGFVLFGQDFESETPESLKAKIASYQSAADLPLLIAVDEEGGTVTRISRYSAFRDTTLPSPRSAYAQNGMVGAISNEDEKCRLLYSLDINVNLGPVCDISTDPDAFMYGRSLGQDAATTADYVTRTVQLMDVFHIGSVLKHFPGYGNNADTHTGIAVDTRSLSKLEETDLIPFAAGIEAGCGAILVSHTIVDAFDMVLPASLSPAVHTYLRETMGFEGVIMTDDLVMEAITDQYGAGEAAVLAVLAGNDLLCSSDYITQHEAVLAAVLEGRIPIDTLCTAVRNVLEWKQDLGLI